MTKAQLPRRAAAFALLLAAACASTPHSVPSLRSLTLREKIGQLFMVRGQGVFMNETSFGWKKLEEDVVRRNVGGFVWFTSNVYETAEINRRLQARSKVPLLIAADLESGVGMRFSDTTYWPWAMAVAATGDPSLAEREGRAVGIEARALGVNHIYAPVADVNVDPDNSVINARSYGEDPETVARFVAAFIRGVRSTGVLTTAKHFPGHGDTHTDSHRSLPILGADAARLSRVELVPFRAAVDAGVDAVMVGHLSVPAVDPTPAPIRADAAAENPYTSDVAEVTTNGTLPASLSKRMIDGILRRELGFRGLVVGDAFDMGALVAHFGAGEAAVRAIEAGEDQVLTPLNLDEAIDAVEAAVRSGRLTEARIDESVARILDAKRRAPSRAASPDELFRVIDSAETRNLAAEIARKAITLVRQEPNALPLRNDAKVVELVVSEFSEVANPLADLDASLTRRLKMRPQLFVLDARSTDAEVAPIVDAVKNADVVLIALAIRTRSGHGSIAVPPVARRAIEQLAALPARRIGVSFGTPYLLREVPSLPTYLCAYGAQPVMQTAALRALFGEAPITGRLPVTIPGFAKRGDGIDRR